MKKTSSAALVFLLLLSSASQSLAVDVKALRNQAYTDVLAAVRLKQEAERTLKEGGVNEANLKTARTLYTEAGKMFERAYLTYNSLAPDNATEEDVARPKQAMERCVQTIREIQIRLTRLQDRAAS